MSFLIKLLKPAPYLPEMNDQEKVKSEYKYWRIRIMYSMMIGYALFYFTRNSFTFAMPGLIQDLQFDKSQLGILGSVLSITYGLSKFASGVLADKTNPRYFMAIGLMLTGIFNICFGLSSTLIMFALFWGLNGWFQGCGALPCARFLTQWYSHSERGSWWSTWNVSHNIGAFLIPWIVGFCLYYFGSWRIAMYVPGIICIFGGLFLMNRLRDTPQSLGLPPIEKFRNDYAGVKPSDITEKQFTTRELLITVLKNPYVWMLAVAYFFVYAVRTGVSVWTLLYLIESKGYGRLAASGSVSLFDVGGFFGSLASGWSSDYFFRARRGPVNALFAIGILAAVTFFWFLPGGNMLWDSIAIFALGFTIFGPQMLIGMAAAEIVHKKAAATSNGFVGWVAYLGAAAAGYPMGVIIDSLGWTGFFWTLIVCSSIAIVILLPLWNVSKSREPVGAKAVN